MDSNDITLVPVDQPPLKPLESCWWEESPSLTLSDDERRFIEGGEAKRLHDAEEGRY